MQGDQEARNSLEDDFQSVLRPRMAMWASVRGQIWLGLDWAGLEWAADGRVAKADLIRDTLATYAPYWDRVVAIWLEGESGLTGAQLDAKARYVLEIQKELGLARRPFTVDVLEAELNTMRPQDATLVSVWIMEGIDAGAGSGNRAEDARLITSALDRQLALLPASGRIGVWYRADNRNGQWAHSLEDMAAIVMATARWCQAHADRMVIDAVFCWVRGGSCSGGYCGGGARDYPLVSEQLKRAMTYRRTGADPGPEVPTPPPATPEPTPLPSAPGVVWTERNTATIEPGPTAVPWQSLYLKLRGKSAPPASIRWHAACQTPGPDCPDVDGVASWPAGGGPLAQSSIVLAGLPAEAQCCARSWHWTLSEPVGGIAVNDDRGNIQARTALPGVSWLLPNGVKGESKTTGQLVRGGDCSQALTVYLTRDAGTVTDAGYGGTDVGAGVAPIREGPITMDAGACWSSYSQSWLPTAVKGHAETLTITGTSPAVHIGRVPTVTLAVQ
jgi:hypothetical protein